MKHNVKDKKSWAGGKRCPFRLTTIQIFCILFLPYFSKSQIKRFGDFANKPKPLNIALSTLFFYT